MQNLYDKGSLLSLPSGQPSAFYLAEEENLHVRLPRTHS